LLAINNAVFLTFPEEFSMMTRKKGQVRFAVTEEGGVETTSYEATYSRTDSCDRMLWWTKPDRAASKLCVYQQVLDARGAVKTADGRSSMNNYSQALSRVYNSTLKGEEVPDSLQTEFMYEVALQGHSYRGLEKYIVDDIKENRSERREELLEYVLNIQSGFSSGFMDEGRKADLIRMASESVTHQMKVIAQVYGKADAFASKYGATGKLSFGQPTYTAPLDIRRSSPHVPISPPAA
jgi:hypothetical protein